jgi:hypothetical protein
MGTIFKINLFLLLICLSLNLCVGAELQPVTFYGSGCLVKDFHEACRKEKTESLTLSNYVTIASSLGLATLAMVLCGLKGKIKWTGNKLCFAISNLLGLSAIFLGSLAYSVGEVEECCQNKMQNLQCYYGEPPAH